MKQQTETFPLSPDAREILLANHGACTLIWSTRDGWPVGVTMGYLWANERFWLTTGPERPRVAAIRRDPRGSIVVCGEGQTVTAKGRCTLRDDRDARDWVYPAFAAHQAEAFPGAIDAEAFAGRLARTKPVILEIAPEVWIEYDGTKAPVS